MASAEWISEWHRTATNQEPIFCPKAPSSAAQRLFVSDGVARPLRRDDVVGRTSGTDMPANAVAGKSCKRPDKDDDTLHDTLHDTSDSRLAWVKDAAIPRFATDDFQDQV